MSIYTRTGDHGDTTILGGKRVPKDDSVLEVYGVLDELNSMLGVAVAYLNTGSDHCELKQLLTLLQQQLFDLGSIFMTTQSASSSLVAEVADLEGWIDIFSGRLPALTSFILPGGTVVAAHLHVARTIARRAERCVVAYARVHAVAPGVLAYMNRISDLLFILARYVNFCAQQPETTWQPAVKRGTI